MKAIVTGGAGFIGSHITQRLLDDGHEVIILDDLSSGKVDNVPEAAALICANVIDTHNYGDSLRGVDVVFHNAASKKNICLKNPAYDLDVNGKGTLKLLMACKAQGVKSFIHASTGSVYGEVDGSLHEDGPTNPVSYYGISKLAGENYARMFAKDMNVVVLRYFHVYGPRQEDDPDLGGVVAVFKKQIKNNCSVTIHGDGSQKRVFTHVNDIVEINMKAWEEADRVSGNVYNCASNIPISVMALAGELIQKSGKKILLEYKPPLEGDIYNFNVDNRNVRLHLGVNFTAFKP